MNSAPIPIRCFAPDEFRHSTPERVAFGTALVSFGIVLKPRSLHLSHDLCGSIGNRRC